MIALLAGFTLVAQACGDSRADWPEARPRIDLVSFLSQLPQSPGTLVFEIEFEDSDGDLGTGNLFLIEGCEEQAPLPMATVFANQTPALDRSSTTGSFEINVSLGEKPESGEAFELGFLLEDEAGMRSNEFTLELTAVDNF